MASGPAVATMPAFGTVPAPSMVVSRTTAGTFDPPKVQQVAELSIHPFAHALHYGSSCFEGLKAHRGTDGVVRLFRHERHVERMRRTAELMYLPIPPADLLASAIYDAVDANLEVTPAAPGALYLRPLLLGMDPNIGAAAARSVEALLLVLASPVGNYFASGESALRLLVETSPRTTPQFGEAKAGANYVMALGVIERAHADYGVDQVLFAPDGDVQETGAANFLLLDDDRLVTRSLDGCLLHGVTRDAILTLARDLGYQVEERRIDVEELLSWRGEAALTGTAAVLSGVGSVIYEGREVTFGDGTVGPNTRKLRDALVEIQRAERPDLHGWLTPVVG